MVAQSLASLLQRASIDDHEEVLQSCNAVLTKSKADLQAQHMKVVALLKLDRYEEALKTFPGSGGDTLKQRAGLEYAYASYNHLEAQVRYRAENFRRAAELYMNNCQKNTTSFGHEVNDLNINSWATDTQLQWKGETEFVRHICRTSEDLSPDDKAAELLPIAVQQLYVLIQLERIGRGRGRSSKDISVEKPSTTPPDATNNDRLFEFQDRDLIGNSHAADLLVQKYDGIIRSTIKAQSKCPSPSTDAIPNLLLCLQRRILHTPKAKPAPQPFTRSPHCWSDDPQTLAFFRQWYSSMSAAATPPLLSQPWNEPSKAWRGQTSPSASTPGLLSVLVSLYQLEGRAVQIRTTHSHKPPPTGGRSPSLPLLSSAQQPPPSCTLKNTPTSPRRQPWTMRRLSLNSTACQQSARLIADIDVSALESAGISPSASSVAAAAAAFAGARKRTSDTTGDRAGSGVRKSRLPKDFDPAKKPRPGALAASWVTALPTDPGQEGQAGVLRPPHRVVLSSRSRRVSRSAAAKVWRWRWRF
ncbi:Tetratricopeptide-like helical [Penicillium cf. griseofulvum]|nr:Tetratricopeptide-like helical [Penicillium cf. griseofulvum]